MKFATLNLRHHQDRWEERFPLVVQTLLDADADLVGLQEVSLQLGPQNQAELIADEINKMSGKAPYNICFTRTRELTRDQEGIAILSRFPVNHMESIALPGPWRVAQRVTVEIESRQLCFANTHLHHEPWTNESIRLPQVQRFMDWVTAQPLPCVMSGDYNAQPHSTTIQHVKLTHRSAHEAMHGREPDQTYPTPLVQPVPAHSAVIDYLFFSDEALKVTNCTLIGTQTAPHDDTLCASDHYGVMAEMQWRR